MVIFSHPLIKYKQKVGLVGGFLPDYVPTLFFSKNINENEVVNTASKKKLKTCRP